MKYKVTNRGQPRGFIGDRLLLNPGDNVAPRETVRLMAEKSKRFRDHRDSHQVSVFPGPSPDENRVRLEPISDTGEQRQEPEEYRARKYEFSADETKELTPEQLAELRTDARFRQLAGEILVQGEPEEGDLAPSTSSNTSATQSTKPSTKKSVRKTDGGDDA